MHIESRNRKNCCISVTLLLAVALAPVAIEAEQASNTANYGKYPNSVIFRTRTAATYPQGLTVYTLIGRYLEFDEYRVAGNMVPLPPGAERSQTVLTNWLEYGFTDRFQAGFALPYIMREETNIGLGREVSGWGDLLIYPKYRLFDETARRPQVSIDAFVKLPTGDEDDGLSNGEFDLTLGLQLSKRLGDFSVHFNPDYAFTGGDRAKLGAAADDRIRINTGAFWYLHPKFLPAIEWNSMWWGDVGHEHQTGVGFLWYPAKIVSLKLSVAAPIDVDLPYQIDYEFQFRLATWF